MANCELYVDTGSCLNKVTLAFFVSLSSELFKFTAPSNFFIIFEKMVISKSHTGIFPVVKIALLWDILLMALFEKIIEG